MSWTAWTWPGINFFIYSASLTLAVWLPLTQNSCWVRPWAQHVVCIISFNPHTIPVQRWDEGGSARPLSRDTRLGNIWIRRTQIFETKAHFLSFFKILIFIHLFIWQHLVLVTAHEIIHCGNMESLSWSMWDLVPWLGIEPKPPALGMPS